jgi:hypothetical protein
MNKLAIAFAAIAVMAAPAAANAAGCRDAKGHFAKCPQQRHTPRPLLPHTRRWLPLILSRTPQHQRARHPAAMPRQAVSRSASPMI